MISIPVFAIETVKRLLRLKRLLTQITRRSKAKFQLFLNHSPIEATKILSLSFSITSILAETPLLIKASVNLLAAIAAPPVFSLVFTISTFIYFMLYAKVIEKYETTKRKDEKESSFPTISTPIIYISPYPYPYWK